MKKIYFEIDIQAELCQAMKDDKVYLQMEFFKPSRSLFLGQSRLITYHPERLVGERCVYFLSEDECGPYIGQVQCESEVPEGCIFFHNWILDLHIQDDISRGITPILAG